MNNSSSSASPPTGDVPAKPKSLEKHSRSAARIASVQALYQMETADTGVARTIEDFTTYWMTGTPQPADEDGAAPLDLRHADQDLFTRIVTGVVETQSCIDPYLERQLAKGWTLKRLDATARAILRAALYEIIREPGIPAKVIIDEYISLSHAFFDGDEPKFINGVLDAAVREARADEVSR
ncbi:MAG: transcription antitermination factor NusB [Pseudomonadota bacterium]